MKSNKPPETRAEKIAAFIGGSAVQVGIAYACYWAISRVYERLGENRRIALIALLLAIIIGIGIRINQKLGAINGRLAYIPEFNGHLNRIDYLLSKGSDLHDLLDEIADDAAAMRDRVAPIQELRGRILWQGSLAEVIPPEKRPEYEQKDYLEWRRRVRTRKKMPFP